MTNANVNDFTDEKVCVYKNEKYSVRNNGAVLRHSKDDGKNRKNDNIWTFGEVKETGYLQIANARVHLIVATAFYGEHPTSDYVVDHIDTNRQNNRPENLRWVTRLENILLNPITCKKIEMLCGCPIEEVLKDISILQEHSLPPNIAWMKTVTQKDAEESLERLLKWAEKPQSTNQNRNLIPVNGKWHVRSLTRGAVQVIDGSPPKPVEFPCCPQLEVDNPLESYFNNTKAGAVFIKEASYAESVIGAALSDDHRILLVACKNNEVTDVSHPIQVTIMQVTYEDGFYIHWHDKFYPYFTNKNGKLEHYWRWEKVVN